MEGCEEKPKISLITNFLFLCSFFAFNSTEIYVYLFYLTLQHIPLHLVWVGVCVERDEIFYHDNTVSSSVTSAEWKNKNLSSGGNLFLSLSLVGGFHLPNRVDQQYFCSDENENSFFPAPHFLSPSCVLNIK